MNFEFMNFELTISPKAILFDMDGVLFDSMPNHAYAWSHAMTQFGLEMTAEEAYLNEGRTGSGTINILAQRFWGRDATEEEKQRIYRAKSEVFNRLPEAKPIITSCFLFAFVWQWTDGFYARMFMSGTTLVSTSLSRIVDSLGAYIQRITGVKTTISIAYSNCILATGTLMIILPLIILYLFAQRQFVESISSTGIKM